MGKDIVDDFEAFEKASRKEKEPDFYELKLYITGINPNSVRAVRNIKNICGTYLNSNNYSLEIIDVYQNADLARGEEIVATPTLVKKTPGMVCKLVGDLSDTKKVLRLLDINKPSE